MSQVNSSEQHKESGSPATESVDTSSTNVNRHEWAYSGKAMRGSWIFLFLIMLLAIGGLAYAIFAAKSVPDKFFLPSWIGVAVVFVLLWGCYYTVFFYRTLTIRYELTEDRLYLTQGFFTKTRDTTELLYIDDLRLILSLWDRLFNGGVGKIEIYSSADKTDKKLLLLGIENPQELFRKIDSARAKVRAKRGFITGN